MKRLSKTLILTPLILSSLYAQESDILSQTKQDILNYSYEKSLEDSLKLEKDWINPLTYTLSYDGNDGEDFETLRSSISISQPIFKSGGIYYAIKYANSMGKYSKSSINLQKKELIKQTVELLFEIKKVELSIKKQKLLVKNAKLDITRKKEQVLNGLLDTSFLDNAILDANTKQNRLIDLEHQKQTLINNLATLSDKKYTQMELPKLTLIDDTQYIKNNIYMKNIQNELDTAYWMKNMMVSNYLPTFNLTANYTKYHDTDGNLQLEKSSNNIGFNITIPIDIRYSNSIQSSKIEYLQKKASLEDQKKQELTLYKNALSKIKSLDKKIAITQEDVELYDSLLTQLQEQFEVGMKTESDVQTMQNSKKIKKMELQSLEIDKQIELLEIYARVYNG